MLARQIALEHRNDGLALSHTPELPHRAFESFLFVSSPGFCLQELHEYAPQFLWKLRLGTVE